MYKIKLVDTHFAHAKYSTDIQESKYIVWDRSPITKDDQIGVYTDTSMDRPYGYHPERPKMKIGWMLESPAITAPFHQQIKRPEINKDFDLILTNNREHIELNPDKFKFCPTAGCWIYPQDQQIYEKTKLLSAIFSDKRFTNGQSLRHQIVTNFKNKIDTFGRGYFPLPNKIYGLKDYAFSLVIENTKQDYYFTEKLIDCFVTGTVPIYWGCPSIGDFFNKDGMICFNDIHDIAYILNDLSLEKYNSMLDSVKENLEKSMDYLMAENYMFEKYIKNYV